MMMVAESVTALAVVALAVPLWKLRRAFQFTALNTAWPWFALWWLTLLAVRCATIATVTGRGSTSVAWYLVVVTSLAPGIAILGCRWPTARVWGLFVILPLLAVFSWPVLVVLIRGSRLDEWGLETPMAIGGILVAIMGAGNFIGSRWTFAALSILAAQIGLLLSVGQSLLPAQFTPEVCGTGFCMVVSVCVWRIHQRAMQVPLNQQNWDRLWTTFQDRFGFVWSRRIVERFNEYATQKQFAARLDLAGWIDVRGESLKFHELTPEQSAESVAYFRWLLQKFVHDDWINAQLSFGEPENRQQGAEERG